MLPDPAWHAAWSLTRARAAQQPHQRVQHQQRQVLVLKQVERGDAGLKVGHLVSGGSAVGEQGERCRGGWRQARKQAGTRGRGWRS